MQITQSGTAGTLESGDIFVQIEPMADETVIELESTVKSLYGRQIEAVIRATLAQMGADGLRLSANDKGALDCTVEARVKTALLRAAGAAEYQWGVK